MKYQSNHSEMKYCKDDQCPFRDVCYRHQDRVPQNEEYPSYYNDSPRTEKGCREYYGPLTEEAWQMLKELVGGKQ